jgi:hypothetical protein
VAEYLESLVARREAGDLARQTKADAERRLAGFVEARIEGGGAIGELPADAIRPRHVEAWLATREGWGPTSRNNGVDLDGHDVADHHRPQVHVPLRWLRPSSIVNHASQERVTT